ncbi:MAG: M61 family metallopeptidase [Bacteroidetes bacterium]|nr:M61 family metallopeptidase [Bacteroidota bacterium]
MNYCFSFTDPQSQYIQIEFKADAITNQETLVCLPAWRPGRYELGNFAKNIQQWKAYSETGEPLTFTKTDKNSWLVHTKGVKQLIIKYNYYAAQLDAGACWLNHQQMYVNPIHCSLYIKDKLHEPCNVEVKLPANWQVATSLAKTSANKFSAEDFHELVDSPLIASSSLKHIAYTHNQIKFHIHIQGDYNPETEKLLNDFENFTRVQFQMMKEFPKTSSGKFITDYHFLIQALPSEFYHGVEHLKSTVLAIGPAIDLSKKNLYNELIGVASHELFHVWNIKAIRPKEMLPYDYSKENYARTGYVYEGITTYYGDLFLARCGFFTLNEYFHEIALRYQKHVRNDGRFNYSVAQSSFDTWLDGYTPGVPGRKTSIYDEGSLIALMIDFTIRKNTSNKKSLDDVMTKMFTEFGKRNIGYTENDFKRICEKVSGFSFDEFFNTYISSPAGYESKLNELLLLAGLTVSDICTKKANESFFGLLLKEKEGSKTIAGVAKNSPAYNAKLSVGDEILFINDITVGDNFQSLLSENRVVKIKVKSNAEVREVELTKSSQSFFPLIKIELNKDASNDQLDFLKAWCNGIAEKVH